ncbi:MAG: dephospho-CoA kinase [Proteobacteria bacterium]|nr:dephospho-CoA kinase [Pseudomonadota bacterium]
MWIIGITGAIGAGKSSLSKYLKSLGVPIHSSDKEIHLLLEKDLQVREKIIKLWPNIIRQGKIDRELLGEAVLFSPNGLAQLEKILYPRLVERQKEFLRKNQYLNKDIVALDVPLLFEVGLDRYCHCVILASTPSLIRKERVLKRKGMTLEKLKAFESQQLNDRERRKWADYIIPCGREKGSALKMIKDILETLSLKKSPIWQGKWPKNLRRNRYGTRDRFRY